MIRSHSRSRVLAVLAVAVCALPLPGQIRPEDAVRKIADQISREMAEIDRLLLESSRAREARTGEAGERVRELIDSTRQSQDRVVTGIDQLIDELQQMAQQSQSQSSSSQQQDQQQGESQPQDRDGQNPQPGGEQQQGPRRESATPDLVQQGGEQSGQQPGQQPEPGQNRPGDPQQQPGEGQTAAEGQDPRSPGQNRDDGGQREDGSERVDRGADTEGWGDLQKYVPSQYQRAGAPDVPARYRRLHEAFQKRRPGGPAPERGTGGGGR
jgi:hypothetical protein